MTPVIAFDVYGTLIDTQGVVEQLRRIVGDRAEVLSRCWRNKQLEYSFRRGLMQRYENFAVCTRQALDYCCEYLGENVNEAQRRELLAAYRTLPVFADVVPGLASLQSSGCRMYAFSNGGADAVEALLSAAGIRQYFLDVVSVDEIGTFKPSPAVYQHFLQRAATTAGNAWLVSGNPFDVIGAVSAGMHAAWLRRSPRDVFDPWGMQPDLVVSRLDELDQRIASAGPV